jgi:hypothetical protein
MEIKMKLTERFLKGWFILSICLFAVVAMAELQRVGANWYLTNTDGGELTLGTESAKDIKVLADQGGTPVGFTLDESTGDFLPYTDNTLDLGTSSVEFKDAFFDGTVTLDALSMPLSVVAGANTACSTTCTGLCMFGVNTAATEADIVDCADATADECLCVE